MRHGNGRFEDGAECYNGEWADDKMNGQGRHCMPTNHGLRLCHELVVCIYFFSGTYVFASKAVYEVKQFRLGSFPLLTVCFVTGQFCR